jgi:hypothetical protein
MQIGKKYKSNTGAIRTPLYLSSCKKFVFVNCVYKNGINAKKFFWANHRLFNDEPLIHPLNHSSQ